MSWIADEIEARGGAVPLDAFMELALYHPQHGYYSSERSRTGRGGDYLTAPTASPWYARTVAGLLAVISEKRGVLRLIDVASGDGSFLADVCDALAVEGVLREMVSVERSREMRRLQKARFGAQAAAIRRLAGLDQLEPAAAPTVLHASELFDAMPVASVVGRPNGLHERWVTATASSLELRERAARDEVVEYFRRHRIELAEGQLAEANLAAEATHRHLLRTADGEGLSIVLDYGYDARKLYDGRGRGSGSLTTFRGHRMGRDPLECPGELDLTSHVNWDDLRSAAVAESWTEIGLWPLAEFLVRAGLERQLERWRLGVDAELDANTVTARQEIKRLLDPDGMGSDLKVLVQATGEMVEAAKSALTLDSELGIQNDRPASSPGCR